VSNNRERFLNTPKAAEYLGLSRSTLDKWRASKIVLPFYRERNIVRYDVEDLDRYLELIRVEPVAYGVQRLPAVTTSQYEIIKTVS
jgi:excisionase family DNA binding protein